MWWIFNCRWVDSRLIPAAGISVLVEFGGCRFDLSNDEFFFLGQANAGDYNSNQYYGEIFHKDGLRTFLQDGS